MNLSEAAKKEIGIYSIPEAARYAKMHPNSLRNWFCPTSSDKRALEEMEIDAEFKAITFVQLAEAVAIRSLRTDYGVSFQKIREALKNARNRYGVTHPFAQAEHKTVLIGSDLHIFLEDDFKNPVQLTGRNVGQKSIRHCIEQFMKDFEFDENGCAKLYNAFAFRDEKIVLDPKIHFGEPVVKKSGHTANTLYKAAVAEGGIERAAEIYEVSPDEVEAAYLYFNRELGVAA